MAKPIKITDAYIEDIKKEFSEMLTKAKLCDGKISFSRSFAAVDRKARVFISELAWLKMVTLIEGCSQEVAWHATARRLDTPTDDYLIGDIMVYPQTVTAATVEMDEQEYSKWLMAHSDDDRFDEIHCQMHSHVNMGVSPSGTDIAHQEEIVNQLRDDGFYIFMIWNKRHEANIKIYDLKKNIMFETSDITWTVVDGEYGLQKFLEESKALLKQRTASSYYPPYNPTHGYTPPVQSGNVLNLPAVNTSLEKKGKNDNKKKDKKNKQKTKLSQPTTKLQNAAPVTIYDENGDAFDINDPFGVLDGRYYME